MVLPERGNPEPWDWNRGHMIRMEQVKTAPVADPHIPVAGCKHRRGKISGQPLGPRNGNDAAVTETVETLRSNQPEIAFPILIKVPHVVAGESVLAAEMIHRLAVFSINAVAMCAHPNRAVAIDEERIDLLRVDSLKHEFSGNAINDLENTETFPRNRCPNRTVRERESARNGTEALKRLELLSEKRFERAVIPFHQLVRGADPE